MNGAKECRRNKVIDDVGDMMDGYSIASMIYDEIVEQFGFEPTVEQCLGIWHWVQIELKSMILRHVFAIGRSEGWDEKD